MDNERSKSSWRSKLFALVGVLDEEVRTGTELDGAIDSVTALNVKDCGFDIKITKIPHEHLRILSTKTSQKPTLMLLDFEIIFGDIHQIQRTGIARLLQI